MTYSEKVEWLKRYRYAQRTMRLCMEELEQLRSEAASVSQALTGMPGGGDGQAIPRAVERIADAESRLVSAYGAALAERSQVEKVIETEPDPLRRDILIRRYIIGQRWERIAADNNFTLRRVLQIHHKTVEAMEIA